MCTMGVQYVLYRKHWTSLALNFLLIWFKTKNVMISTGNLSHKWTDAIVTNVFGCHRVYINVCLYSVISNPRVNINCALWRPRRSHRIHLPRVRYLRTRAEQYGHRSPDNNNYYCFRVSTIQHYGVHVKARGPSANILLSQWLYRTVSSVKRATCVLFFTRFYT